MWEKKKVHIEKFEWSENADALPQTNLHILEKTKTKGKLIECVCGRQEDSLQIIMQRASGNQSVFVIRTQNQVIYLQVFFFTLHYLKSAAATRSWTANTSHRNELLRVGF